MAIGCGKPGIRIIPPLNISMELLDVGLDVLEGVIKDIDRGLAMLDACIAEARR